VYGSVPKDFIAYSYFSHGEESNELLFVQIGEGTVFRNFPNLFLTDWKYGFK